MIIIPAIDIKNGKCVRLYQGREDRETIYGEDPAAMALRWQKEGARYLHVVDLDGAFSGTPQNLHILKDILSRVTIPVEFGGGLRDREMVRRLFKMGVDRVIIGTAGISDRTFLKDAVEKYGRQIFVGLDARGGYLLTRGWTEQSKIKPVDILKELQTIGVGGVVCTDIATDGTLSGPNTGFLCEILDAADLSVIASGGVKSIHNIGALSALKNERLFGVIIGRALYTGDIKLDEAIKAAKRE